MGLSIARDLRCLASRGRALAGWRAAESCMLVASWLLLVALSRAKLAGVDAPPVVRVTALGAVLWSAWLLPGWLLWRLATRHTREPWIVAAPAAAVLGLFWLLLPAAAVLLARGSLREMTAAVSAMTVTLIGVYLAVSNRSAAPAATPTRIARPGPGLLAATALAALAMMAVSARCGLTRGSDEWVQLAATRYFLESSTFTAHWMFDTWSLVLAFLVRLSGADLFETCRIYLPPAMVLAALLSQAALAWALFQRADRVCLALLLLAVYGFSDMTPRGDGAGMAIAVRILEDKYLACFVAVPLALAVFLRGLLTGARGLLVVGAVAWLTATMLNPMSLLWAGLPLAVVAGPLLVRRKPAALIMAACLLGAGALGFWLRSLRPSAYFRLHDSNWGFNSALLITVRDKLLILSPQDERYMADPELLMHPFLLAAIAAAVFLLPRSFRSPSARYLVGATLGPVLLLFNPWTAPWLGGWITPWLLDRVLWMIPASLVLAYALSEGLEALARRTRSAPTGTATPAWLASVVVAASLLDGRFEQSRSAVQQRNRVWPTSGERQLARALAEQRPRGGTVLAPADLSIRLPAWSSAYHVLPGLQAMRFGEQPLLTACSEFYASQDVGEQQVELLQRAAVRYIIVSAGSALDDALRRRPHVFRPLHLGDEFALYGWRPERWTGAAP